MIDIEQAKEIAIEMSYGMKVVSFRTVDGCYLIMLKRWPNRAGADGCVVLVAMDTGKAEYLEIYTKEGFELFSRSKPI